MTIDRYPARFVDKAWVTRNPWPAVRWDCHKQIEWNRRLAFEQELIVVRINRHQLVGRMKGYSLRRQHLLDCLAELRSGNRHRLRLRSVQPNGDLFFQASFSKEISNEHGSFVRCAGAF